MKKINVPAIDVTAILAQLEELRKQNEELKATIANKAVQLSEEELAKMRSSAALKAWHGPNGIKAKRAAAEAARIAAEAAAAEAAVAAAARIAELEERLKAAVAVPAKRAKRA